MVSNPVFGLLLVIGGILLLVLDTRPSYSYRGAPGMGSIAIVAVMLIGGGVYIMWSWWRSYRD